MRGKPSNNEANCVCALWTPAKFQGANPICGFRATPLSNPDPGGSAAHRSSMPRAHVIALALIMSSWWYSRAACCRGQTELDQLSWHIQKRALHAGRNGHINFRNNCSHLSAHIRCKLGTQQATSVIAVRQRGHWPQATFITKNPISNINKAGGESSGRTKRSGRACCDHWCRCSPRPFPITHSRGQLLSATY